MLSAFVWADETPLDRYLKLPQRNLPEVKVSKQDQMIDIEFSSQRWQNVVWTHRVLLLVPKNAASSKTAILFITGDGPKKGDYVDLNLLAAATSMPIAMLFNIPNQPIWDMKEDDLIAHTFEKYISTGDETWPLLFPMTKSAIKAMDVVQQVAKQNQMQFDKFVVTGASKRGWTTWMTAATQDKRVAGIAPLVYDNLNIASQMPKQISDWGKYSDQIEDYTRRGLQAKLETAEGRKLVSMIDPYFYRKRLTVPKLIVNGANDPYWTVDAHTQYMKDLPGKTFLLELPNSGHGMEDRARAVATVGAFARSLGGAFEMPELKPTVKISEGTLSFNLDESKGKPIGVSIWSVESDTKDFRSGKWVEKRIKDNEVLDFEMKKGKWNAVFVEARYSLDGRSFTLSSPVNVLYRE